MPKVSDAHRAAQRQRIIDAAIRVAGEKGLASTSMAEIIKASGLSAGAIYGYFEGKEQLIAEVAAETISTRILVFDEAASKGTSPADLLRTIVTGIPQHLIDTGLIVQVWAEAPHTPGLMEIAGTAVVRIRDAYTAYLTRWLVRERGLDPDAAQARAAALAPALVGLVQGFFVSSHLRLVTAEAYLDGVDALLADL